jgi:hypothetical protein
MSAAAGALSAGAVNHGLSLELAGRPSEDRPVTGS